MLSGAAKCDIILNVTAIFSSCFESCIPSDENPLLRWKEI